LEAKGELYFGRDLINKSFQIVPQVGVTIYGIFLGGGCDAALAVTLKPITVSGWTTVEDFYPLEMNVPKFTFGVGVNTGVQLTGSLIPYLSAGVGTAGLFAGLRLKGRASLKVDLDLNASLELYGDQTNFGGELKLGAAIRPYIELGFQPWWSPRRARRAPTIELMDGVNTASDIFVFRWNKSWKFDRGSPGLGLGRRIPPQRESARLPIGPTM
jgi:hypothetical protein